MRKYFIHILCLLLLLGRWRQGYSEISTTSIEVYSSPNPKLDQNVDEANMLKIKLSQVANLQDYQLSDMIKAHASGGEVRMRIFSYRPDVKDGKRMLIYELWTNLTLEYYYGTSETYTQSNWPYEVMPAWINGTSNWVSENITTSLTKAAEDYMRYYNCWNNPQNVHCANGGKLKDQEIPIIVEITIHKATLLGYRIPGLGEQNLANLVKLPGIQVKGSNYEVTKLSDYRLFGHANNKFLITEVKPKMMDKCITGLYDNLAAPEGYFKATPKTGQQLYVALEKNLNIGNVAEFAGTDPVLYQADAFKMNLHGYTRTYSVYELRAAANHKLKFTAKVDGPFLVAQQFDVFFQEDLALPVTKRKLFHRGDWLNDILVCAHRGLWSKVGRHDNPDFSGIAENTIPAYELAINDPNIDWIEFDARRTSDGVFVAWHDDGISRVSSYPDPQDCIPVKEVNARDKLWRDAHQPLYHPDSLSLKNKTWDFIKDLYVRDYMGCKVKNAQGEFMHPLALEKGFEWLRDQKALGRHSVISVDYKDGKYFLDEVYKLILKYDLEGQVLLSVYAKDYSLADYQEEYGQDFLRQIPLKPTFYEPVKATDYGGNVLNRFNEYINAPGHFVAGFTLNVNYDKDDKLIAVLKQPSFPDIAKKVWYMSHYNEPFMSSITDNNRLNSTADCDPRQHPLLQLCCNLFWRADFDWLLNNGTNAIFSDNTEALVEYLKAKGKK